MYMIIDKMLDQATIIPRMQLITSLIESLQNP
jgi:hypothetical protein